MSIKVKIKNSEEFENIQKKIFKMDGAWCNLKTEITSLEKIRKNREDVFGVLIEFENNPDFDSKMRFYISYLENKEVYKNYPAEEIDFFDFISLDENEILEIIQNFKEQL